MLVILETQYLLVILESVSNFRHLERSDGKYGIRVKRLNVVVEELKHRITAIAAKVRRYQG